VREREFVKQNSEAQIKRNEQTTTSTKKNKTEVFLYTSSIPQTILLSYIHSHAYKHVFQFEIKKKKIYRLTMAEKQNNL